MNNLPAKFNCLVLPPKKSITDLRVLLFEFPNRGEKIERVNPLKYLRVTLEYNETNRLRPLKIEYKECGMQYLQTKEFIALLRKAKNIYLPAQENLDDLCAMLEDYQIKYTKIKICRFCILDNRITFLEKEEFYRDKESLCYHCAMKEISDESAFRGFHPNVKFSQRIGGLLKKFQDVGKILKIFEPGFDGSKHPEFTYYDTLEATPNAQKEYPITEYDLPNEFLTILKNDNITKLLPIQKLAIENGLLEHKNLLIGAPTGTGKTLIGELASISNYFRNRGGKILYLGNLVALVNQKYEVFKHRYPEFKVAIKVGMSKIDVKNEDLVVVDEDVQDADIICGSYEGFDFLLRKGEDEVKNIGKLSTIIIDEIQTLEDEERGVILAGLIARIAILFPEAQIIGLSATIGNVKEVGKLLHLKPFSYTERTVPLERHIILCKSEHEKLYNLIQLVKSEKNVVSKYGYKGSTIIFTNARLRCEYLAMMLQNEKGINAMAYHAGLTYNDRKFIERAFERGLLHVVCTTYALGAGFDTPCSSVLFESFLMGNKVLSPNMYWNMMGRAGRFHRHEKGKVYHLMEIGKAYFETNKTEDEIALELLESPLENLTFDFEDESISSQVLAAIAAGINTPDQIEKFYDYLLGAREELTSLLRKLKKQKCIEFQDNTYGITTLGRAIALSFFTVEEGLLIVKDIQRGEAPLDIAIRMEFFENIYILEKIRTIFLTEFKISLPNKFITARVFDITAKLAKYRKRLRKYIWLPEAIAKWEKEFFSCKCGNAPYCDCPLIKINKKLINLRIITGLSPKQISRRMERHFALKVYSGDLLRFFDDLIHKLEGIKRISKVLRNESLADQITTLIHKIENPM